jgi:aquaporin Z
MLAAFRHHWPEYLMEAAGLGLFMISACIGTVILWHPDSPVAAVIGESPLLQRLMMGAAMGLTAILIVYSPMGKRSGAHINPAFTLTFLRLGKIEPWDAAFYVAAQFMGALLGVYGTWLAVQTWISDPDVNFAVTVPGSTGYLIAFLAEAVISFGMMTVVLWATNKPTLAAFTGIFVGCTLVIYITFEAPLSGMSMNPARTVGSAIPAGVFRGLWIYFVAPLLGMLAAAELYLWIRGADAVRCAKLYHTADVRCIFRCGYAEGHESDQTHQ